MAARFEIISQTVVRSIALNNHFEVVCIGLSNQQGGPSVDAPKSLGESHHLTAKHVNQCCKMNSGVCVDIVNMSKDF